MVPQWAAEVSLMLAYGYTERQLREEFTIETLERIQVYRQLEAKADEERQKKARLDARVHSARH